MPTEPPVIVGVGLTRESLWVLRKVAGLVGDPARIIAVHVLEKSPLTYSDETAAALERLYIEFRAEAIKQLKELCEPLGITRYEVFEGRPAQALHKLAEETNASIVAVGSHGDRGWQALLGGTANAVMHDTRNNVLTILTKDEVGEPPLEYRNILVAVDQSNDMDEIVAAASRTRDRYGAELTLLSVIKPLVMPPTLMLESASTGAYEPYMQDAEKQCRDYLDQLASQHNIKNVVLKHGYPAAEIHETAEELGADLVVLGTHGTHGPALLLGSTTNAVLHGMTCDVLAIRVGLN